MSGAHRQNNAERLVTCLREFGFDTPDLTAELFDDLNRIIRMGEAPLRIEILMDIDGVDFDNCVSRAEIQTLDGNTIPMISLSHLNINKLASGSAKDLNDSEHLP